MKNTRMGIARITRAFVTSTLCLTALLSLNACLSEQSLLGNARSDLQATGVQGCISGKALSSSRIEITFEFPTGATQVQLKRDGLSIATFNPDEGLTYVDTGLNEGQSYRYTCEVKKNSAWVVGENRLVVSTLAVNAPDFAGVKTVTNLDAHTLKINWNFENPNGVPAAQFKVFVNAGPTVDWTATPRATVPSGTLSTTISDLGDELKYSVGVRACSDKGYCDVNTVVKDSTLPDGGAPTTLGAMSVRIDNGKAVIVAPWEEINGAIKKRLVYQRIGPVGGTDLSNYTLVKTEIVAPADQHKPPATVTISPLDEYTTYHFIVRDVDPSEQANTSTQVATLATGDLTPPVFLGITNLAITDPKDSSIMMSFAPVAREGTGDTDAINGASQYLVYLTSAPYGSTPTDPCLESTPFRSFSTGPYPPGAAQTYTLTGLTPRTTYRVCMKAKDAGLNISANDQNRTVTTIDITPPRFDGIQAIRFNNQLARLELDWNPSESADVSFYRLYLWKESQNLATATVIDKSASGSSTGATLTKQQYAFEDGDKIYALVQACDTAGALPGGAANCTTLTLPKFVSVPDATPPANFPGISTAAAVANEGQALVSWYRPAGGFNSDYNGFRIFSILSDGSLLYLADVNCTSPGVCPDSYTVTGLDARRTYKFHVQAFDAAKNLTNYLDPSTSFASALTADKTPPVFSSNLTLANSNPFPLTWTAASDNQYALENGAVIKYEVYRKAASSYADPTRPFNDGTKLDIPSSTVLSLSDLTPWLPTQGETYYFTVCAVDAASNRKCDGTVRSLKVPDLTKPTIHSFSVNNSSDAKVKRWTLNYKVSDNGVETESLNVYVYEKVSTGSASPATRSDTLVFTQSYTYTPTGAVTLTTSDPFVGPVDQDAYVNYLLVVRDSAGNETTATASKFSQNVMTFTQLTNTAGAVGKSNTVLIKGTGFSVGSQNGFGTSTTVHFVMDGQTSAECTDVTILSSEYLTCKTPAYGVTGNAKVTVRNPDGSSAGPQIFAYKTPGSSGDPCIDNPNGNPYSKVGGYTAEDPNIICNKDQLARIGTTVATASLFYFKLGNHIDLAGADATFKAAASFRGHFDGADHAIMNYTRNDPTSDEVGLFGLITPNGTVVNASIKHLLMLNFNVTGRDYVGALVGRIAQYTYQSAATIVFDDIYLSGTVSGRKMVGGLVGYSEKSNGGATDNVPPTFKNIRGVITANGTDSSCSTTPETGNVLACGHIGGLFGHYSTGDFTNSANLPLTTIVNAPGISRVGGFAGSTGVNGKTVPVKITGLDLNSKVTGRDHVGGVAGYEEYYPNVAGYTIQLSSSKVVSNVSGDTLVGGVIGTAQGNYNSANVLIDNLDLTATVTGSGGDFLGGVAGRVGNSVGSVSTFITVTNSKLKTTIQGTENSANRYAGGLAGWVMGGFSLDKTSVDISVSKVCGNIGGLVGYSGGINSPSTQSSTNQVLIKGSITTSTINANCTPTLIAGLAGLLNYGGASTISNTLITLSLTGGANVSGLSGSASAATYTNVIVAPTSIASNGGGLVYALMPSGNPTLSNVYYTFSGNTIGTSTAAPNGSSRKSTAELQAQTSDIWSNYDFTSGTGKWYWPATSGTLPSPRLN